MSYIQPSPDMEPPAWLGSRFAGQILLLQILIHPRRWPFIFRFRRICKEAERAGTLPQLIEGLEALNREMRS